MSGPSEGFRSVRSEAADLADHPVVERLARVGYLASGLVHLLMGWIAIRVAIAGHTASADQSGAFSMLTSNPAGKVLLWVAVAGFAGLALLLLLESALPGLDGKKRAKDVAKGLAYVALAVGAFGFARGHGQSSSQQAQDVTGKLMSSGIGQLAVGAVGLVIIGVGVYHVVKGVARKFHEDLTSDPGSVLTAAGIVGYVGKGLALIVAGGLFVIGALRHDPSQTGGLDTALKTLLAQPFGLVIVIGIGVGFICYGVYSFGRAKYARL